MSGPLDREARWFLAALLFFTGIAAYCVWNHWSRVRAPQPAQETAWSEPAPKTFEDSELTDTPAYVSRFEKELQERERKGGLAALVPEPLAAPEAPPKEAAPEPKPAAPAKPGPKPSSRDIERAFVREHDKEFFRFQLGVVRLALKHYLKEKAVRKVNGALVRLPRYMDLTLRYLKDRDIHEWARGVASLPEVRRTLKDLAKDPEVWRSAFGISSEVLAKGIPDPVQREMARFFAEDDVMGDFVDDFVVAIAPDLPRIVTYIPPGMDPAHLRKFAADIAPKHKALFDIQTGAAPAKTRALR